MKIALIQVGKTKDAYIADGLKEYEKRLQAFCDLETVTLKEATGAKDRQHQMDEEGARILEKLAKYEGYYKILLEIHGKELSSEECAAKLKEVRDFGTGKVLFIIAGPYGSSKEVKDACDASLSFGKMTFTHQMIRLMLIEQIYRAFTIIEGKQYHY